MADEAGERTEKPTAKRLSEAVNNGDVLQSRELATALVMLAGVGMLMVTGDDVLGAIRGMLQQGLRFNRTDVADFDPATRIVDLLMTIALPVSAILFATFAAAIAAPALLGSLGFRASAFQPKFSKLNPVNGLKRIFGLQGIIELSKSLVKILFLGAVGIWMIWDKLTAITALGSTDLITAMGELGSMFMLATLAMSGMFFLIAGIDVPLQIFQRGKRLAMTKQQIKEEHKETEGSPEAKGHIRRKQFEMSKGSAREAVKEATVVITNPTHFAVALRYQPGRDEAPIVVARGRGDTALAIRELAEELAVPMLQYPELARAIYYTSRAGSFVEEQLYMAVAAVLAFVFRIENRMAGEMDRPHITVPDDLLYDTEGRKMRS